MISTAPHAIHYAAILLCLVFSTNNARAELIIHETFEDDDFEDGSPGLWIPRDGSGTLEVTNGDLHIDTVGGFRTMAVLTEVDGKPLDASTDWSIRARLTPITADSGWVGVGMTQLNHASFYNGRFETGHQLNTDAWDDRVSPLNDEEFMVQMDAFDDTLTGYAWRTGSPAEIMTASFDFGLSPSLPVLFTHGTAAKFHEAWVSTTPIPLPGSEDSVDGGDARQELSIVSPNNLSGAEGDSVLNSGCCPSPFRFQQVFPAEDFAAIIPGGASIIGMAWRPDGDAVTSPKEISLSNTEFRFSTTNAAPNELSLTFDDNIGDDETVVLTGDFSVSKNNTGPAGGPKEFDYVSEFETPFYYDPSQGNLLWEWTGSVEASLLNDFFSEPSSIVFASPPGPQGTRFGGFVVEFTLVRDHASLQAGDADQNLSFDQLDIIRVSQAGKYLSGAMATWGEGDWNGAPGGSVGSPPAGDGVFNQLDIIAALGPAHYLTGPYGVVRSHGQENDGQTSVVYDPSTGEIAVDAPADTELTSINIDSASGIFTGKAASNLGGSFDNDADNNIFKATFGSSFGSMSFGNVAQTGLTEDFLRGDLTVIGSLEGGGPLGHVDLIYVPEPTSVLLLAIGALIGVVHIRSNRSE